MDEQKITADIERREGAVLLSLGGSLNVWLAEKARDALGEALGEATQRLEVDLEGIDEVDLTGLQLLCAAHRSAADQGKTLLVRRGGEALRQAAFRAGFLRHRGCMENCPWAEGGTGWASES